MEPDQHRRLTVDVVAWARTDARVLAVVGVGSTAGVRRQPDRWSDHDLVIVCRDRASADELRSSTDWLPSSIVPALVLREPDHGLTVIDHDGHLLELAIAAHDDLDWLAADSAAVLYATDGTRAPLEAALAPSRSRLPTDDGDQRFRLLVKELVIGIHRAGRGELLSAHQRIRGEALALLLSLLAETTPAADEHADPFDPHRRFERIEPTLAARLEDGLRRPALEVAALLIDVAERELGGRHVDAAGDLEPARAALVRAMTSVPAGVDPGGA
jgi:hypothetical protein